MRGNRQTYPPQAIAARVAISISAVSRQTGISVATLRVWESRYGLAPSRTTVGGHRRYSLDDIARLRSVQDLITEGVPTGEAARTVLAATRAGPAPPALFLPAETAPAARQLAEAALDLDGPCAIGCLRESLSRIGVLATWESVLRPVMSAIGEQWPDVAHGVAVEHLLSHVATVALGETIRRVPILGQPGVLLACAPGELHDLPLIALSAALGATGVITTPLGARTPADCLAEAAERQAPALVVVFSLMPDWAHADIFEDLPRTLARVAAGPGWDSRRLPGGVEHVSDLAGATDAVLRLI